MSFWGISNAEEGAWFYCLAKAFASFVSFTLALPSWLSASSNILAREDLKFLFNLDNYSLISLLWIGLMFLQWLITVWTSSPQFMYTLFSRTTDMSLRSLFECPRLPYIALNRVFRFISSMAASALKASINVCIAKLATLVLVRSLTGILISISGYKY